ncbi:MAG: tRNA 2-selenouridine(34) synthase MnmH [Pseudohongiellaceae bacterium]
MEEISTEQNIIKLLLSKTPLLDVRAPIEFARGALPGATNIPLLDDEQRAAVGKAYRQAGQTAAIEKGHTLVTEQGKAQRINEWQTFLAAGSGAALYCLRGGLRSHIAQQWLAEHGSETPLVTGGYRRVRRLLLARLETLATTLPLVLVAGKTGSGKTSLINALPHSVDLEGLANHRGSAFGQRLASQPSQANFENELCVTLLRQAANSPQPLFLEDESRSIGALSIPLSFYQAMQRAPLALIESTAAERSRTIMQDYILSNYAELRADNPASAQERFSATLRDSLARIQKRLGGDNYHRISKLMEQALRAQFEDDDGQLHLRWIDTLLNAYYDPMYDYQLSRKLDRVVFRGSQKEFLHWTGQLTADNYEQAVSG